MQHKHSCEEEIYLDKGSRFAFYFVFRASRPKSSEVQLKCSNNDMNFFLCQLRQQRQTIIAEERMEIITLHLQGHFQNEWFLSQKPFESLECSGKTQLLHFLDFFLLSYVRWIKYCYTCIRSLKERDEVQHMWWWISQPHTGSSIHTCNVDDLWWRRSGPAHIQYVDLHHHSQELLNEPGTEAGQWIYIYSV